MQLDDSFDSIISFIKKACDDDASFDSINTFITKAKEELREGLKLAQPGNTTIGISFEPNMVLDYVPSVGIVPLGTWVTEDASLCVEVLSHDALTGLVRVEVYGEEDSARRFDFFSTTMFLRLFTRTKPGSPHQAHFQSKNL